MITFCNKKLTQLEEHLGFLELEYDDPLLLAQTAIELTLKTHNGLKKRIIGHKFKNAKEEIYFFKKVKPRFLAKLIYYNEIYKIETSKPYGGKKVIRKYLYKELDKLKRYFDDNLDFYKYYRTGSAYLDHKYFLRKKHDIRLSLSTHYFESDHRFSTSHDYKVAKILANDLIEVYLEDQLSQLDRIENDLNNHKLIKMDLQWTESKTALIELIYALHAQGVFNNRNADIKSIAALFEAVFKIDLGDYYRNFLAIRIRKKGRAKFLDDLKKSLIAYMDAQDE